MIHKLSGFITKKGEFITKVSSVPLTPVQLEDMLKRPSNVYKKTCS